MGIRGGRLTVSHVGGITQRIRWIETGDMTIKEGDCMSCCVVVGLIPSHSLFIAIGRWWWIEMVNGITNIVLMAVVMIILRSRKVWAGVYL